MSHFSSASRLTFHPPFADFPSIGAQASQELTIAVIGAVVGDAVVLGLTTAPNAGVVFTAWVSAAGIVTVRATNITGAAIDPVSVTFNVLVFAH